MGKNLKIWKNLNKSLKILFFGDFFWILFHKKKMLFF